MLHHGSGTSTGPEGRKRNNNFWQNLNKAVRKTRAKITKTQASGPVQVGRKQPIEILKYDEILEVVERKILIVILFCSIRIRSHRN